MLRLRAALPVRRARRRRTTPVVDLDAAREARSSPRSSWPRSSRSGLFPDEPLAKTELAAQAVPAARVDGRACRRPRDELARRSLIGARARAHPARGDRRRCSSSRSVAPRPRGALGGRVRRRSALAAGRRVGLYVAGVHRRAVPGQFSTDPAARSPRPSCWRWRCPCCCSARDDSRTSGPFCVLLMSSLYGVCLMLSSDSFLTLFLGLELMSLPVYVLVLLAYRHGERRGRAQVPGAGRRRDRDAPARRRRCSTAAPDRCRFGSFTVALARERPDGAAPRVVLVLIAFFLKAAIVPFHAWAPDAYEGASVPVTAYMATMVKAGRPARRACASSATAPLPLSPSWTCSRSCRSSRSSGATWPRCGRRASAA